MIPFTGGTLVVEFIDTEVRRKNGGCQGRGIEAGV